MKPGGGTEVSFPSWTASVPICGSLVFSPEVLRFLFSHFYFIYSFFNRAKKGGRKRCMCVLPTWQQSLDWPLCSCFLSVFYLKHQTEDACLICCIVDELNNNNNNKIKISTIIALTYRAPKPVSPPCSWLPRWQYSWQWHQSAFLESWEIFK